MIKAVDLLLIIMVISWSSTINYVFVSLNIVDILEEDKSTLVFGY